MGYELVPWQEQLAHDIGAVDASGKWVHPRVGISIPRQQGKSVDLIVWVAVMAALAGYKVLWTEHNYSTTMEMVDRFRKIFGRRPGDTSEGIPRWRKLLVEVCSQTGQEWMRFSSGGVIQFSTRTKSSRLGFSFDIVIYDEAQELTGIHTQVINPTTTSGAKHNLMIVYAGTPTRAGNPAEVFKNLRQQAWEGGEKASDLLWLEFGVEEVGDIWDESRWPEVMPSLGYHADIRAIRTGMKDMDELGAAQEYLGYWLPPQTQVEPPVIGAAAWGACLVGSGPGLTAGCRICAGVRFSADGSTVAVACAVRRRPVRQARGHGHAQGLHPAPEHRPGRDRREPHLVRREGGFGHAHRVPGARPFCRDVPQAQDRLRRRLGLRRRQRRAHRGRGAGAARAQHIEEKTRNEGEGHLISIPYAVASADGLLEEDRETVRCLLNSWQTHYRGNLLRSDYYEARNMLKDLGIAVPDSLRDLEVACGWGYKCVEVMRDHIAFDGFTCPDDEDFDDLLTSVAKRNKMATRVGKAVNSALKYCFSMLVVTADEDGHARISAYPPTLCTGIWDDVHECLPSGMFVVSFAKDRGRPTNRPDWVNVMLPDRMVRIREVRRNEWAAEYVEHGLGAVPMFVMPHNPDDDRPFGVSRINSEVRWLIDCALRANVNEEIAAAFAASTQKYLLGTDGDAFADKTKWSAFIGSIFEVTKTEDGTIPQFGQLTQPSMQPMTEHFGNLCKRMSAATGIHVGQFGIMSDNPSSAEAIYAENEPLILKCKSFIREAKAALANAATAAIATELGCSYEEAEDACGVSVHFLNPAMPTLAQQTDSSIKLASVVDGFAGTPTFWRLNGLDDDEVRNVSSEIRRNVTRSAALDLMAGVTQAAEPAPPADD